jgi:hypothetical protein
MRLGTMALFLAIGPGAIANEYMELSAGQTYRNIAHPTRVLGNILETP